MGPKSKSNEYVTGEWEQPADETPKQTRQTAEETAGSREGAARPTEPRRPKHHSRR